MQRAEHEVAGFRRGDRQRDGFEVAHFSHHDDVGIFAQCAAQGRAEGFGVGVDFALGHVAALRLDDVFDRIFERDDVVVPRLVHLVHEGRERGGFARTHGPGHEHEAIVVLGEQLERFREPEIVHRAEICADDPEDDVDSQALAHHAGAKASEIRRVGKIDIAPRGQEFFLGVGQEVPSQGLRVFCREGIRLRPDGCEQAVPPPDGLGVDAEMQVRGPGFLGDAEILVHVRKSVDGLLRHHLHDGDRLRLGDRNRRRLGGFLRLDPGDGSRSRDSAGHGNAGSLRGIEIVHEKRRDSYRRAHEL